MGTRDAALARRAAEQHGVVTAVQAEALGLTTRQVQLRIEDGTLVRLHRGVYRHAGAPETPSTDTVAESSHVEVVRWPPTGAPAGTGASATSPAGAPR